MYPRHISVASICIQLLWWITLKVYVEWISNFYSINFQFCHINFNTSAERKPSIQTMYNDQKFVQCHFPPFLYLALFFLPITELKMVMKKLFSPQLPEYIVTFFASLFTYTTNTWYELLHLDGIIENNLCEVQITWPFVLIWQLSAGRSANYVRDMRIPHRCWSTWLLSSCIHFIFPVRQRRIWNPYSHIHTHTRDGCWCFGK